MIHRQPLEVEREQLEEVRRRCFHIQVEGLGGLAAAVVT